jgi:hypothetical protein
MLDHLTFGFMLKVAIKLCLALLLLTLITQAQNKSLEAPQDNQAPSFKAPPVSEVKISGAVVMASIRNGDFVHPTFSPDGKTLAYSKVLVQRNSENTEVLLCDLSTQKTSVLLNSRKAKQYATYAAFVTGMNWKSARRLEVFLSDGDVGSTTLTFDPYSRRLLRMKYVQEDELGADQLSPTNRKAFEQAQSLFPSFPRDVLESALKSSAPLVIPDQGIVLQKDYAGHDSNVWFLDFQNRSIKALIDLPERSFGAFNGGASFNSSILMLVSVALGHMYFFTGMGNSAF